MKFFQRYSIDLGTANTLISDLNGDIILHEPTVIALEIGTEKVIALGIEAEELRGRNAKTIELIRPLKDGVIFSQEAAELMLSHFIRRILRTWTLFLPRVIAGIPSGASDIECRALKEVISDAGAKLIYIIKEPVAAAIGAGLPVTEPIGSMVIDIGGGTSEVAIVSMTGLIFSESIKIAGNEMTEAIQQFVKQKYRLKIGFRLAEEIKHTIGSVHPDPGLKIQSMEIAGVDLISGLPSKIQLTEKEIHEVLMKPVEAILAMINQSLENLEPELAADVAHNNITLVGGGALLKGFDVLIMESFGLQVTVAVDPMRCVVIGASEAMADPKKYDSFLTTVE